MEGWTTTTWEAADWALLANVNDFVNAIQERHKALGNGTAHVTITTRVAGDDVQLASWWNAMQAWVEGVLDRFAVCADAGAMRAAGHYDGAATVDAYADLVALFSAAGLATTDWRRYTTHPDEGGADLGGKIVAGDIIGPWLFEDLQAVLNVMVWTKHGCSWVDGGVENRNSGTGGGEATWAAAVAAAEADYAGLGNKVFDIRTAPFSKTYGNCVAGPLYGATCDKTQAYNQISDSIWTGLARDVDWYVRAQTPTDGGYSWTFHAQGQTVADGVWKLWLTDTPGLAASTVISSAPIAPITTTPTPFPPQPGVGEAPGLGWATTATGDAAVVRWNVTDGFTYTL